MTGFGLACGVLVRRWINSSTSATSDNAQDTGMTCNITQSLACDRVPLRSKIQPNDCPSQNTPDRKTTNIHALPTQPSTPVSPEEICDALRNASPVLADALEAQYKGLPVQWEGNLQSVSKYRDVYSIFVTIAGDVADAHCDCARVDPSLLSLRKDAPVVITGVIDTASNGFFKIKEATVVAKKT
ncbi:MAG: hypothetical protein LBK99_23850 [Opitutaceae bacterium]|nr:hypothetical protein [Opitutaceae bacterium]